MWKLALNHANILSKQQTVGKMSHNELLSPDNSGSCGDNVLLAQKIDKQGGVVIRMSWYVFEKINSQEGMSILVWRVIIELSFKIKNLSREHRSEKAARFSNKNI